ncbi:hypothetical protein SO802_002100 [Lithocarpus litseifolius]|uniref:Reverse transcriptase zinc-binding domain-containing protein n=1 Tax=Lithocarpus litseifolius TaxID=425828 RepID=A0AAW2E1L9_9ROSI
MKATPLPSSNQGADRLSWFSSPNGDFKLKEAYRLANWVENYTARQQFKGDWVWKVATLPKIKCFLWQCCHQSIPVGTILAKRGMDIPFLCPMCNNEPETIIHALRDCPKAQSVWNSLSPLFQGNLFYGLQLVDWLNLNFHDLLFIIFKSTICNLLRFSGHDLHLVALFRPRSAPCCANSVAAPPPQSAPCSVHDLHLVHDLRFRVEVIDSVN